MKVYIVFRLYRGYKIMWLILDFGNFKKFIMIELVFFLYWDFILVFFIFNRRGILFGEVFN